MQVSYRPAASDDFEFLFSLHRATMRLYVVDTWGAWDEDWQNRRFRARFKPELLQIIQYEGSDIGVLQVQDRTEEIFLVSLEILPAYQNHGIGSAIIRSVLVEASHSAKPVALQVLKVNRAARALYQRLGFRITGENETHYILAKEVE